MIDVVLGILVSANKVLLAERPLNKSYSGYWEFPGGKIEDNELAENAIIRELNEELGIKVINTQFVFSHQYHYPDRMVQLNIWLVTEYEGAPWGKEGQRLLWCDLNNLQNLNLLPGNVAILDSIKKRLAATLNS